VLTDDQIEAIHEASLSVLRDTGMDFLHPEAIAILRSGGADVTDEGPRVRFDPELIEDLIETIPAEFEMYARDPARNVRIGARHVNFLSVGSAPNASSLDSGRRPGTFEDFSALVKLTQYFNVVSLHAGYPVEPIDIDPSIRHLTALAEIVRQSDKVFHAYSLGRQRILDALEIVRIARGVSMEQLVTQPSMHTVVNTSSPLRLDGPMIEGMIEMLRHGQVVVLTPFTLSGAMAPATIAGALVQQNAEALAGMAFSQLVEPGSKVVYGGFTSNVDMRSGSPAFGTPEYTRAAMAGGQLARRYGVPYRSSNATAANAVDAQAAYEAEMSLWGAVMGGANVVMHGAGWMEGGLVASFEKFIIDVEMLQMMSEFLQPMPFSDGDLGVEAIADVGPGGHFFGTQHTLDRYETAFYAPIVSDWQNFEAWELSGARDAATRANRIWKQALEEFVAPGLPAEREAELQEFVERRIGEGGVGPG
jgi:trimethylamine--corrinoid protein Co-methyltransferase